jgi:hypothetical protein
MEQPLRSAAEMDLEFMRTIERGEKAEHVEAALAVREALASPRRTPAVLSDELLEVLIEVVDILEGVVDVVIAKDLAPDLQAHVVPFFRHHIPPCVDRAHRPPHPEPAPTLAGADVGVQGGALCAKQHDCFRRDW